MTYSKQQINTVLKMYHKGFTTKQIAAKTKVNPFSIRYYVNSNKKPSATRTRRLNTTNTNTVWNKAQIRNLARLVAREFVRAF